MVYAQPTAKDKSAQHTSHDITYNILLHISRQRTYSKHNQVMINNNNRISIQRTNISWFISEWTFTFLSFIAGLKNCLTVNETSIRKRLIRWFRNQFPPSFPVLHCTLGQGELQACLFPDVVFPPLPLSALSSSPFHCALQDGFGQTWWTGNMTIPLQFASLYACQEVFVWSNCLLHLGTDFLVGNMVFVPLFLLSLG